MIGTYWENIPTPCTQVVVQLSPEPGEDLPGLGGSLWRAVRVDLPGKSLYIDDHDGAGWRKVTEFYGAATFLHRELPVACEIQEPAFWDDRFPGRKALLTTGATPVPFALDAPSLEYIEKLKALLSPVQPTPTHSSKECPHLNCLPKFDEKAAYGLDEYTIRKRWPRFQGVCPDCGVHLISYASAAHFIAGDW